MSNALTYIALATARGHNLAVMHHDTSLQVPHEIFKPVDPQQARMTRAFFGQSCEIGHFELCKPVDSDAVTLLRRQQLPPVATKLLGSHSYSSAYHLLKELSLLGEDEEVVRVAQHAAFDIRSLAEFAVDWYLTHAVYYASHGREQDAMRLFDTFIRLMLHRVKEGEWLSMRDVDATDLPVVATLFCDSTDLLNRGLCLAGILKALGTAGADAGIDGFKIRGGGYVPLVETTRFAEEYGSLPPAMRSSVLTDYLRVWQASEMSLPAVATSPGQKAAWYYARGVILRDRATASQTPDVCVNYFRKSRSEFSESLRAQPGGYFSTAAQRGMEHTLTLGEVLCSFLKSSND